MSGEPSGGGSINRTDMGTPRVRECTLGCDRSFIASLNERPDSSPETIVGRLLRPREQLRVKTGSALLVTADCAFAMLGEREHHTPSQDLL